MTVEKKIQENQEILWKDRIKKGTGLNEANLSLLSILPENMKGMKVFELGSGTGDLLQELKSNGTSVQGSDISEVASNEAIKRAIPTVQQDLNNSLPFADNEFDLSISVQVFMHLFNPDDAIKEMKRVSKKYVALNVPNHLRWKNRFTLFGGTFPENYANLKGHIRLFNYKTAKQLLEKNGLKILKESYTGSIPGSWLIPPLKKPINSLVKVSPGLFATSFSFFCEKR